VTLADSAAVLQQWERIKASEKRNGPASAGLFKRLPPALPALMFAGKVAGQIEAHGFAHEQFPDEDALASMAEGLDKAEAGGLLFQVAAACRRAGIDAETALRKFATQVAREIEAAEQRV
jgi:XTP/dITP diphosphohydrolase/tetrapyrrole methylase family protein/MazG family protein